MNGSKHDLCLFWTPGRVAPSPRSSSVNTESPEDIFAYQDEVTALETLREKLRVIAQTATGTIHELPQIEGAPKVIEKPWTSIEPGQRYVAWNLFAIDPISGLEVQLSKRLENIGGGVMWLEAIRSNREVVQNSPPQENVAKGYKCEDCRRYSYEQGQEWLNQETHRFEKANAHMWRAVVELLAENQTISSIGKAVTSITDQQALFDKIVEGAVYITEADTGWLLLRQDSSKTYILSAQRNLPPSLGSRLYQAWDDGISSLVALSGEPLSIHGETLQALQSSATGSISNGNPCQSQK